MRPVTPWRRYCLLFRGDHMVVVSLGVPMRSFSGFFRMCFGRQCVQNDF